MLEKKPSMPKDHNLGKFYGASFCEKEFQRDYIFKPEIKFIFITIRRAGIFIVNGDRIKNPEYYNLIVVDGKVYKKPRVILRFAPSKDNFLTHAPTFLTTYFDTEEEAKKMEEEANMPLEMKRLCDEILKKVEAEKKIKNENDNI